MNPFAPGERPLPAAVAVSGAKNSGKTTLIAALLPLLRQKGLRVAVVKHDGHRFEPERPGVDTRRFYDEGALGVAVFDGEKLQLVRRGPVDERALLRAFDDMDLVLLEGFKHSAYPKLELLRGGEPPRCDPKTLLALVCGEELPRPAADLSVLRPDDAGAIADIILAEVERQRGRGGPAHGE